MYTEKLKKMLREIQILNFKLEIKNANNGDF